MNTRRRDGTLSGLRTLFHLGPVGDLTDGQLLERFATGGGEAAEVAFAALIERHGALVRQTCRAVLRDEHESQDAFQATFLTLVRKARSLWVKDSLGPWLHQVAYRAARSGRAAAARRARLERKAAERLSLLGHPSAPDEGDGFGAALHEAIAHLPERYRAPVVLCDLEGRTHEQAARHLGCPVGTVKSRLSRGRERLRAQLSRHGLTAHALPLAGLLPRSGWEAPWSAATAQAAVRLASGQPAAAVVSARVLGLMGSIFRELFMKKVRSAAVAVVALAGVGGMAWAGFGGTAEDPKPGASRVAPEATDLRGDWELLYLGGGREGYPTPGLVVPITADTINLPTLTGKADDPIHYLGAMPYALDPDRNAGAIDMAAGPAGASPLKGIYRLKGDILTICYEPAALGRPGTFAAGTASESVVVLRRAVPQPAQSPRPGPNPAPTGPALP